MNKGTSGERVVNKDTYSCSQEQSDIFAHTAPPEQIILPSRKLMYICRTIFPDPAETLWDVRTTTIIPTTSSCKNKWSAPPPKKTKLWAGVGYVCFFNDFGFEQATHPPLLGNIHYLLPRGARLEGLGCMSLSLIPGMLTASALSPACLPPALTAQTTSTLRANLTQQPGQRDNLTHQLGSAKELSGKLTGRRHFSRAGEKKAVVSV